MRTREEIEDEGVATKDAAMLLEVLLDLRDLFLASEERARQFAEQLERLRGGK